MPVAALDRIPLPNLKTYSCVSVLALSGCAYFAMQVIRDPDWSKADDKKYHKNLVKNDTMVEGRSFGHYMSDVFTVMIREPVCVWVSLSPLAEYQKQKITVIKMMCYFPHIIRQIISRTLWHREFTKVGAIQLFLRSLVDSKTFRTLFCLWQ